MSAPTLSGVQATNVLSTAATIEMDITFSTVDVTPGYFYDLVIDANQKFVTDHKHTDNGHFMEQIDDQVGQGDWSLVDGQAPYVLNNLTAVIQPLNSLPAKFYLRASGAAFTAVAKTPQPLQSDYVMRAHHKDTTAGQYAGIVLGRSDNNTYLTVYITHDGSLMIGGKNAGVDITPVAITDDSPLGAGITIAQNRMHEWRTSRNGNLVDLWLDHVHFGQIDLATHLTSPGQYVGACGNGMTEFYLFETMPRRTYTHYYFDPDAGTNGNGLSPTTPMNSYASVLNTAITANNAGKMICARSGAHWVPHLAQTTITAGGAGVDYSDASPLEFVAYDPTRSESYTHLDGWQDKSGAAWQFNAGTGEYYRPTQGNDYVMVRVDGDTILRGGGPRITDSKTGSNVKPGQTTFLPPAPGSLQPGECTCDYSGNVYIKLDSGTPASRGVEFTSKIDAFYFRGAGQWRVRDWDFDGMVGGDGHIKAAEGGDFIEVAWCRGHAGYSGFVYGATGSNPRPGHHVRMFYNDVSYCVYRLMGSSGARLDSAFHTAHVGLNWLHDAFYDPYKRGDKEPLMLGCGDGGYTVDAPESQWIRACFNVIQRCGYTGVGNAEPSIGLPFNSGSLHHPGGITIDSGNALVAYNIFKTNRRTMINITPSEISIRGRSYNNVFIGPNAERNGIGLGGGIFGMGDKGEANRRTSFGIELLDNDRTVEWTNGWNTIVGADWEGDGYSDAACYITNLQAAPNVTVDVDLSYCNLFTRYNDPDRQAGNGGALYAALYKIVNVGVQTDPVWHATGNPSGKYKVRIDRNLYDTSYPLSSSVSRARVGDGAAGKVAGSAIAAGAWGRAGSLTRFDVNSVTGAPALDVNAKPSSGSIAKGAGDDASHPDGWDFYLKRRVNDTIGAVDAA